MGDFRDLPLLPEAPSTCAHYHALVHKIWGYSPDVNLYIALSGGFFGLSKSRPPADPQPQPRA